MRRLLASAPIAVLGTLAGVVLIFLMLQSLVLGRWGADPTPPRDKTPAEVREELERADREKLGTYGWVDKKAGRVRIPIEDAMEKLLAEAGG